ncbi:MAG TPA: M1 family aminopeptidase, partial [Planctomycetota bacterium]|nr:M1 family aminopeptidase [Planctomycetota bacterium]
MQDRCDCRRALAPEPFAAPDAPVRRVPDRPVDVLSVALDVSVDLEGRSVEGRVEHRVKAVAETVDAVTLDAVALTILDARLDGVDAPFSHDGERLVVRPPKPWRRGDEHVVEISYRGRPERGLWFVAPDADRPDKPLQAWTQGQDEDSRFWFPCFDHPQHKTPTEVRASVPRGLLAVSNGALVERVDRGDRTIFHWRQKAPHASYLVTLVVGAFDVVEDRAGAVPLKYCVPRGRRGDALRTFGRTPKMVELFGRLFSAPYPYEKYDQLVVSDFIFGGMENTSATTLYEYVMLDASVEDAADSDWLIAHELGHQWFGDLVTCRDWAHAWLNEGFATYCETLWYEMGVDPERGRKHLLDTARAYFDEARESYRRPIVSGRYDAPTDLFDRHLYEKGACVLHHLRLELGDEVFFRAVSRYVAAHRDGSTETVDLRRAAEAESGKDLGAFFDQWVFAPGHPELQVRHRWDAAAKRLTLSVKQTQRRDDGTPLFRLRTRCRVWFARGHVDRTFEVSDAEHRFQWDLDDDPVGVRFLAEGAPLVALDFERPEGFLVTQLERDDDLFALAEAADALGASGARGATEALAKALAR